MRKLPNLLAAGCLAGLWLGAWGASAQSLPSDWRKSQTFLVSTSGLIKLSLPLSTLDLARAGLEDLRLVDPAGAEMPYLIERPLPRVRLVHEVKSFQVSLQAAATVISIETGLAQPIDTVTLETPANGFIKPVKVEGSLDGKSWQTLVQGEPIFRQANGAERLVVGFPSGAWARLRLTVDDRRSAPLPFTGAHLKAAIREPTPTERLTARISERHESFGTTRLALDLGAANLSLESVRFKTDEPLFSRPLTLGVPLVSEAAVREQIIGQGLIYRLAVPGQTAAENLSVALAGTVPSRQLRVLIQNEDSPPLPIREVEVERYPVYLAFLARQPGVYQLLSGNRLCPAPHYDLASLGINLQAVDVARIEVSAPQDNATYRPPEVLPGLAEGSTALEVSGWRFRKRVRLVHSGAQQLELDLEVLSGAQSGGGDLRLLRHGQQVPYIRELTSIPRLVSLAVTVTNDPRDPQLSRWLLKAPRPRLPVTRLFCTSRSTLFERNVSLTEEIVNDMGQRYRRDLGLASWVRKPDQVRRDLMLTLQNGPQDQSLILETRNGDNPPIELEDFRLSYDASRILFKGQAGEELFLYYGNPQVAGPRYDLSLVADELLWADKATASLEAAEALASRRGPTLPSQGGVWFWGILALVVVGLLVVIGRLLPQRAPGD